MPQLFCRSQRRQGSTLSLLFLHGFLGSSSDWDPFIEGLLPYYSCFALDLPAHGQSPYVPDLISSIQQALPPSPVIAIGYSMGGRIALSLANHQQVQGVIALSSHPGLSSPLHRQERLASDLRWKQRLQTLPCEEFLSLWYQQEVFSSLQESPELFQHLLIKRRYQNKEELASVLEMMSLAHQPSFSHCIVPSYFLYGEKDMKAHTLYTKLTGCYTVESIPLCGHTLHLENPTLLTSKIHSWVHKHFEGRQPI